MIQKQHQNDYDPVVNIGGFCPSPLPTKVSGSLASQDLILRTLVCKQLSLFYLAASASRYVSIERWNTTKNLSATWQNFSCLLDKEIAEICKKFKDRAKNTVRLAALAVLVCILRVAETTIVNFQFLEYFSNPLIK